MQGFDLKVASKLEMIFQSGKLAPADLDKRALDALKEFPVEGAIIVLTQLLESNLNHVSNKSAYLCGIMKTYRMRSRRLKTVVINTTPASIPAKGPDEDKLKAILERTGYKLDVTTGQRKYGGPPPNWNGPPPGPGCEVFCGKIPKDMFEDELIILFEKSGTIWDLRLMMDPIARTNRGYGFVTFCTKDGARQAARDLNNYEIKPGKHLKVNISEPNRRLFVGNIPKSKDKRELIEEFKYLTAGLSDVIIFSSTGDGNKNRGFCFLDYKSHNAAFLAKLRLGSGQVKLWGYDLFVDWADPQEEPETETMAKVKVLYVGNLSQECSEENLKEVFEVYGTIDRVRKLKGYAFINFKERDHAINAMNDMNGKEVGGSCIKVSLARPLDFKKKEEILKVRENRKLQIMQIRAGRLYQQHPSLGPMPLGGIMPQVGPMQQGSSSLIQPIGHSDYAWAWNNGSKFMEWGHRRSTAAAIGFSNHSYDGLNGPLIMATPTTISPPMALNAPSEFYQVNENWMYGDQDQEENKDLCQNNWANEPLVQEPQEIRCAVNSMTEVPQWYHDSYRN